MLRQAPKSFVMHWIGNDRLLKLVGDKDLNLAQLGTLMALLRYTNPVTGRIEVTAKHLAEEWNLSPGRVRQYLSHLTKLQVVLRRKDPRTGTSHFVAHPYIASAGTDARRDLLWQEYLEALEGVEPRLEMPTEAELIPHSAKRKFKKRSRLDGPRFAPAPDGVAELSEAA